MVRAPSESIGETIAVLLILFAPMLGGTLTFLCALAGIGIALIATRKRVTPLMALTALSAFAIGLIIAFALNSTRTLQ